MQCGLKEPSSKPVLQWVKMHSLKSTKTGKVAPGCSGFSLQTTGEILPLFLQKGEVAQT